MEGEGTKLLAADLIMEQGPQLAVALVYFSALLLFTGNFPTQAKTGLEWATRPSRGGASGLSDHVWSLEEIIVMADNYMPKPGKRGPYKKNAA
jgi:hypothetical protein